jgi:hypothetical protein
VFLTANPGSDAATTAAGLGVTVRQARNYLNAMTEKGHLAVDDSSGTRAWSVID